MDERSKKLLAIAVVVVAIGAGAFWAWKIWGGGGSAAAGPSAAELAAQRAQFTQQLAGSQRKAEVEAAANAKPVALEPGDLDALAADWKSGAKCDRGIFVNLPFLNAAGNYDDTSYLLAMPISEMVALHKPRGVAIVPGSDSRGWQWQAGVPTKGEYAHDPKHEADFVEYSGATHVLRGHYREEDAEWVVECRYTTPAGEKTRAFRVAAEDDLALAQQVTAWAMAESGWSLSAAESAPFDAMLYGPDFRSSMHGPIAELRASTETAAWADFAREHPDSPAAKVHAALYTAPFDAPFAAVYARREFYDPPVSSVERLAAAACAWEIKDAKTAIRLAVESMAADPGATNGARRFIYDYTGESDASDGYLELVKKWRAQLPPSPLFDFWVAKAAAHAAWKARGHGFANTVTTEGWEKFGRHMEEAEAICRRIIDEVAPIPEVVTLSIQCIGSANAGEGGQVRMKKIWEQCAERYPRDTSAWYAVLEYQRPRWGGSPLVAMALIDRALRDHPDDAGFAELAFHYHAPEGRFEQQGEKGVGPMRDYFARYPDRAAQVIRSAERMRDLRGKVGTAYHIGVLGLMGRDEDFRAALREHPLVYEQPTYRFQDYYEFHLRKLLVRGFYHNGQWEHLLKAQVYETDLNMEYYPGTIDHDAAIALAFLGRFDEAFVRADRARGYMYAHEAARVNFVDAMANRDPAAALERYRAAKAEIPDNTDPDLPTVEAMLLARLARMDEATEVLATTDPLTPRDWDFIRLEALKLIPTEP